MVEDSCLSLLQNMKVTAQCTQVLCLCKGMKMTHSFFFCTEGDTVGPVM